MFNLASLRIIILTVIFSFISFNVFSQDPTKKPPKFGKISVQQLSNKGSEKFSDAHAIVLFDYGNTSFDFSLSNGNLVRKYERHVAIQFLDNTEFDYATFEIYLRRGRGGKEKASKIKGYTYNLVDGKYQRDKLSKQDIFTEEINDNLSVKKFTMPNVKEGSIIEVKYSYTSYRYWDIPNWTFQKSIPTLYSEYNIEIPEFFVFTKNFLGFHAPYIKPVDRTLLDNYYNVRLEGWVMTDLPAFESEDHMRSYVNYISRISFELQMIKYPSGGVESFTKTWKDVSTDLMNHNRFGGELKNSKTVKNIVSQVTGSNDPQHMVALYEKVKTHIKWDGDYGLFCENGIKKCWKDGTGNAADINLTLIAVLESAGFDVKPVVLSTRSNGMIPIASPTVDNLNYVIAAVEINGERYFLDATEDYTPAATIPVRCLNGEAVMIFKNNASPFMLKPTDRYKAVTQNEMTLTEDGVLTGITKKNKSGYAAIYFRKELTEANSEEKFIESLEDEHEGLSIESHTIKNYEDVYKNIEEEYEVEIEGKVVDAGDLIYLNPMLYDGLEENPFKLEKRQYPVDFAIPIDETYLLKFKIPEGYAVETLPEGAKLALPDNASNFSFSAKVVNNEIIVVSRLKIKKTLFVETEYVALKEYYNLITKAHSEQIVLKRQ